MGRVPLARPTDAPPTAHVPSRDTATADDMPQQLADRLNPGCVALQLVLTAASRPAAVAVHDDRDVPRQRLRGEERVRRLADVGDRWRVGGSRERRSGH